MGLPSLSCVTASELCLGRHSAGSTQAPGQESTHSLVVSNHPSGNRNELLDEWDAAWRQNRAASFLIGRQCPG